MTAKLSPGPATLTGARFFHMSMDVAGALRNKSFSGFTDALGRAVPAKKVQAHLEQVLADGVRVLPLGFCDRFSDQTGCPGHDAAPALASPKKSGGRK